MKIGRITCFVNMISLLGNLAYSDTPTADPVDATKRTLEDVEIRTRLETTGKLIYQTSFENEIELANYYNLRGAEEGRVEIVLNRTLAHTGQGVLELTTEDQQGKTSSSAGARYWFPPGYDRVYFRRYIKFALDYDQGNLHHAGGSLYAIAGNDKHAQMGKAGILPNGDDRFGSSFEPWRFGGRYQPPGIMMLYTYWMDMKPGERGTYYGNALLPSVDRVVQLERDRWYCLEHMLQANTIGKADGEIAAWIDGELYVHFQGVRWRSSAEVLLKRFDLVLYVHHSHKKNQMWYDDVALSTGYIGPINVNVGE
ncbi:hypothetical protein [Bythopirellula goksoeyrii]|uniref:Uncharacterized protein n=1 Tax=Bythopirellula goksoeyrii TaxID=1400387 RepID=A0A5B9QF94_9BACT|nr:hypothetical protein [Bythopirellula goksoeyrii]QEG36295.1 hypothetical protein Pr1d_36070 [Bythopirellula goksoeyrii]